MFFCHRPFRGSNHATGFNPTKEQSRFFGYGYYENAINTLEQALSDTAYITGSRFSAADVYVGAQINFGLGFKTIEKRPAFVAYSAIKKTSRMAACSRS